MAVWPAELPQCPLREGMGGGPGWGVISSQPDIGPAMTRRRFTAVEMPRQYVFDLSESGLSEFERWMDQDIGGGALLFDASFDGVVRSYRLVSEPSWFEMDGGYRLSLTLMVQP